jgi:hypothetical protein
MASARLALQGAFSLASENRCAGRRHAVRIPCSTLALHPFWFERDP